MSSSQQTESKCIVCYGDSNTWGYIPGTNKQRYPLSLRWPGVLSGLLGNRFRVIEEGLSGRTTVHDDPIEGALSVNKNGLKGIGMILDTHSPVDLVIIMLGSNDLKLRFSLPARDIATGVELLVRTARDPEFGPGQNSVPDVLVICPPPIYDLEDVHGALFRGGREKSLELPQLFAKMAERVNVPLLYAADFVQSDPLDGLHFSVQSHAALAKGVAAWVEQHFTASKK